MKKYIIIGLILLVAIGCGLAVIEESVDDDVSNMIVDSNVDGTQPQVECFDPDWFFPEADLTIQEEWDGSLKLYFSVDGRIFVYRVLDGEVTHSTQYFEKDGIPSDAGWLVIE